jgi:hypothetical protein
MDFKEELAKRAFFAVTNPTNLSKLYSQVGKVRDRKKNGGVTVIKAEIVGDLDRIIDVQLDVINSLDSKKQQLLGLQAMKQGETAFNAFIATLEE